jgi:alginate O-acetyltransferase complex protein AlgI
MLFNSIDFVLFFIFVLSIIVIIKHRRFQHVFLLSASYFFFFVSSNYLITLLLFSTILDFYVGKAIWESKNRNNKKILLSLSIIGNLGLLAFFKYSDFAITQFNILGTYFDLSYNIPLLELILPVGISFYTFQTLSYTIDIYRGKLIPSKSFSEFALFVSFFPQLVAGPIVRAKDFLPQLREKIQSSKTGIKLRQIIIHDRNLKLGITMMSFGFLKKVFFADNIAPMVDSIFVNPMGLDSISIVLGTIAFGFQIYLDFSAYSDIAIGAALILGFKIPKNFNKPYFATSPSDFWERWHISLSTWLRDYLYIPLGGNKKSKSRTYVNLMLVMVIGGLWHGASWNFLIWGALHGGYLMIHRFLSKRNIVLISHGFFKTNVGKIVAIIITQYFIFLAWIPFRVQDLNHATYAMEKYIFFDFNFDGLISFLDFNKISIMLMILFMILHFISYKKENLIEKISRIELKYWMIIITVIMISVVFTYSSNAEDFIYFRF